jgi:ketosteroid isomerase-like protein
MSQENVEIVKRLHGLLERRDWEGMRDLIDLNVELHGTVGGIGEGQIVARGLGEVRKVIETEDNEVWAEHRWEPQRVIDAGDRVVVLQREYQRGKSSGVELVVETATILQLRGGRVVRMQGYVRPAEALEAVGLSE